jgi:uncharacterized protein
MAGIRVSGLFVYPIKSCAGTATAEAEVGRRGFEGDRQYMLTTPQGLFVTQREQPRMALIRPDIAPGGLWLAAPGMPRFELEARGAGEPRRVIVWRDTCDAVDQGDASAAWFSGFLDTPVRLMRMADAFSRRVNPEYAVTQADETGFADGYPFLLIGEASLADLNTRLPEPVPMDRFRPNIVVSSSPPYAEDGWSRVQVGRVSMAVVKPCARCVITTTDQATALRGREPLATLAAYRTVPGRGTLFGQNLIHLETGPIAVGDPVEVSAPTPGSEPRA